MIPALFSSQTCVLGCVYHCGEETVGITDAFVFCDFGHLSYNL